MKRKLKNWGVLALSLFIISFSLPSWAVQPYLNHTSKNHYKVCPISFSKDFKGLVATSVYWWNTVLGFEIAEISCNHPDIYDYDLPTQIDPGLNGTSWVPFGELTVCMSLIYPTGRQNITIAHELGHCFGLNHSDEYDSIMYAPAHEGRVFTKELIDSLQYKNPKNQRHSP